MADADLTVASIMKSRVFQWNKARIVDSETLEASTWIAALEFLVNGLKGRVDTSPNFRAADTFNTRTAKI